MYIVTELAKHSLSSPLAFFPAFTDRFFFSSRLDERKKERKEGVGERGGGDKKEERGN